MEQLIAGEGDLALREPPSFRELNEPEQHLVVEGRRQAVGIRTCDSEPACDLFPAPLVPYPILEMEGLLLWPCPVPEHAERELGKIQFVLGIGQSKVHWTVFDAFLCLHDSLLPDNNNPGATLLLKV